MKPLLFALTALLVSHPVVSLWSSSSDDSDKCDEKTLESVFDGVMRNVREKFKSKMKKLVDSATLEADLPIGIGGDIQQAVTGVQAQLKVLLQQVAVANEEDCAGLQRAGQRANGEYTLKPRSGGEIRAFCQAGWTVIQRRTTNFNFHRHWNEYIAGFGAKSGDHWIGLQNIYRLTNPTARTLRFELLLDIKYRDNNVHWSEHENFKISAATEYKATMGSSRGNDDQYFRAFQTMQGGKFSANGMDQDGVYRVCTNDQLGGWWYRPSYNPRCSSMNPNGKWNHNGWAGAWSNYWKAGCVVGNKLPCPHGCTGGNQVCAYWHPWLLRSTLMMLR